MDWCIVRSRGRRRMKNLRTAMEELMFVVEIIASGRLDVYI